MKPSKLTLSAAKEFGTDILNGNIFSNDALIAKLYNTFFNKKIDEIYDFIEYIGNFLNDSQIYHLVEKLLSYEANALQLGILRQQKTLGKYLFLYEVKKSVGATKLFNDIFNAIINTNDPEQILKSISFPQVVYHHYKSIILPMSEKLNKAPPDSHFKYVTENVLFNILNTIVMEKLAARKNPLEEAMLIKLLNGVMSLEYADKNYNGISSLMVRQNIFENIKQCILPTTPVQISSDIIIDKLNYITDALLALSEIIPEALFNEIVAKHFASLLLLNDKNALDRFKVIVDAFVKLKSLMNDETFNQTITNNFTQLLQIKDKNELNSALIKLKPDSLITWLTELSIFATDSSTITNEEPISTPSQFRAVTLDMSSLRENDTIENIRIRFQKTVESIKGILDIQNNVMPQNNELAVLNASISKLSQFSAEQWSALSPRAIAGLTSELKTNLSNWQLKLADPVLRPLFEKVKLCLGNIIDFENSCRSQPIIENGKNKVAVDAAEQLLLLTTEMASLSVTNSDDGKDHQPLLPPDEESASNNSVRKNSMGK